MGPTEWALLALLSVLWGGSFFFVGLAVSALPPLTIVLVRVAGAAGILGLVLGFARPDSGSLRPALWPSFLIMGVLNNVVPFCLFVAAQTRIPSGLAAILNATTPLFSVLVAHLATRDEPATGNRIAGAAIGFAGVALMIGPGAIGGSGEPLWADIACLGAALSYAVAGVYGRRFRALGLRPLPVATAQVAASSLLMMPLTLAIDRPWELVLPSAPVLGALGGLAALSTALAYLVYFRLLESAGATNTVAVTFLIPVSAILLGFLFLGERLEWRHAGGMALIGVGLALIDGRVLGPRRAG